MPEDTHWQHVDGRLHERTSGPRHRRWLRPKPLLLGILSLAVALLLAAFVVFKSAAIEAYVQNRALPSFSQTIGRQVEVGSVRARFFPRPSAEMTSISVAGLAGEPPLLQVGRAAASIDLWRLLRSLGKDVHLSSIELVDPGINLVRSGKGWTFEDVTDKLKESEPSERTVSFSSLAVRNGTISILDKTGDKPRATAVTALSSIDSTIDDIGGEGPASIHGRAAFASNRQNIRFDIELAQQPANAGEPSTDHSNVAVTGKISASEVDLSRLQKALPGGMSRLVTGGRVSAQANLSTTDEHYVARGNVRMGQVVMRGQPAEGHLDFSAGVSRGGSSSFWVRAESLRVAGPGIDLSGAGTVSGMPVSARLDLAGDVLDTEQLLSVAPEQKPRQDESEIVPNDWQKSLNTASVAVSLKLARVVSGALAVHDFAGRAELKQGQLELTECAAQLYGGTASLSGTEVDFRPEVPRWQLVARLDGVDLGAAMAEVAKRRPLEGRVSSALTLRGQGNDWPTIRQDVTGRGEATLSDAALMVDLEQRVVSQIGAALEAIGVGRSSERSPSIGRTPLLPIKMTFAVENGWMRLAQPVRLIAPFGGASLGGRIGLDGRVDLEGTVDIAPQAFAKLTGERIQPRNNLTLPIRVGGSLGDPTVALAIEPLDFARKLLAPGLSLSPLSPASPSSASPPVEDAARRLRNLLMR